MKTFASILVISLSLGLFAFTAEAQDIELERMIWMIEPDCLTWATTPQPDKIIARFEPVGFPAGVTPEWEVHFAHQTTELSCPHWTRSWGISGNGVTPFAPPVSTSLHRAFRFRVKWNCSGGVCADQKDYLFKVPDLDFCLDAPEAPVCAD